MFRDPGIRDLCYCGLCEEVVLESEDCERATLRYRLREVLHPRIRYEAAVEVEEDESRTPGKLGNDRLHDAVSEPIVFEDEVGQCPTGTQGDLKVQDRALVVRGVDHVMREIEMGHPGYSVALGNVDESGPADTVRRKIEFAKRGAAPESVAKGLC